ncbi:MAG: succinylglutamate desuccinylase/aspartoacylase family protein [Candidatus Cybelea sp.]
MTDKSKDGLDRKDFMIAAAASVGVSAVLGASAADANAQDAAASTTQDAPRGTVYTGDVIEGKRVVSGLDVNNLEPGKHSFYFQGVQMPTGQHWYVSVMVAKGTKTGKHITLVSGVHGDEMSPVLTVQNVMRQLNPAEMSGTVMAVLDVSRPALEGMARRWPNSGRGIDLVDMNREWPGDENGANAASRHAALLFNKLLKPNSDYAIDFHCATTGVDVTAFNLARMELPEVRAMAELYPIDQIFDNPAYPTLLANAFINVGIPAFTPEIGAPRILDHAMIALFVEGTMNVLKHHRVISGAIGRTGRDTGVFVGNSGHTILATHGGFVEILVKLNEKVQAGQKVATQRNAFGEIVTEYTSGVTGEISGFRTDATAEPGTPLVFIFYNETPREDPVDYAE